VADLSTEENVLLERHRPLLKYDSNESYFADSAAEWTDWRENRLLQGANPIAAATPPDGTPKLSLPFLVPDKYEGKIAVKGSDLIDCKGDDYAKAAHELHQNPRYRNRMYGRAVEDSGGHWWLQYWFFYFYNDFNLIGSFFKAGLHEGDWEMIQLRLGEDEAPDHAVYAQHKGGEVRRWDQVDVVPGTERPFVYVARGSHASYFSPGKHPLGPFWADFADGKRRSPEVKLEVVDEKSEEWRWLLWPGHWGGTKTPEISLPFDADSPVGPAQHAQWRDPSKLAPDLAAEAAPAAQALAPSLPTLTKAQARRDGGDLLIDYKATSPERQEIRGLVITVNSPDDAGVPPLTRTFEAENLAGTVKWPGQIEPQKRYDVHVSAAFENHIATESRRTDLPAAV
jgi:Vacuolar protein sorting-associated protein 62